MTLTSMRGFAMVCMPCNCHGIFKEKLIMAQGNGLLLSLAEQTDVLEALSMLEKSAERAARSTKNPQLIKCHESRAVAARQLADRVSKVSV